MGLSYREIHECGQAIASDADGGSASGEDDLSEEELRACLQDHVEVVFKGLGEPVNPFFTDSLQCALTNRLDRASSQVSMDLIYWTEGRSVPWATVGASDAVPGGVELGEAYDLEQDIDVHGWEERSEPLVWELRLLDVLDAERNSSMRDFGQEVCAAG